jgi:ASC-1-like (ASCH) protein
VLNPSLSEKEREEIFTTLEVLEAKLRKFNTVYSSTTEYKQSKLSVEITKLMN